MRLTRFSIVFVLLGSGCLSIGLDESRLAQLPPLPFRIAVSGGAFLDPVERQEQGHVPKHTAGVERIWSRTYTVGQQEAIPFERIIGLLRRGRAATSVLVLANHPPSARERVALSGATPQSAARALAEAAGADLLVVVDGLDEGAVELQGRTGQWPISTVAWLTVGLGLFIPDHRFESRVRLKASVLDVHTGQALVSGMVFVPGTMDLALVNRTDFLGVLTSIVWPPTLVGNDPEAIVENVRAETDRRLLLRFLARLKDPETLNAIQQQLPMQLALSELPDHGLRTVVVGRQDLQEVVVEECLLDGTRRKLEGPTVRNLRKELLSGGVSGPGGERRFVGALAALPGGSEVRVIVQDVAGRRVSSTIRISP